MNKQKRKAGRPLKTIDQLMEKRKTVEAEITELRKTIPRGKRTKAEQKHIQNLASQICALNRRMEVGIPFGKKNFWKKK
jgi:DNA-binding transcriptional MerR regulator